MRIPYALTAMLGLTAAAQSANLNAQAPAKPLFASSAPLALGLDAPFGGLFGNRGSEKPTDAILTDDRGNRLPIRVGLRGLTRRTGDICNFPPLMVRFAVPPPPTSTFAGQKKLKLITHCRQGNDGDRFTLLEYAGYRLYSALTPKSFGARLATITYREPNGRTVATRPAFFIEDLGDVAARNGSTEIRTRARVPLTALSPADGALYGLFQHMIANHDWSMRAGPAGDNCCHNAKLIGALATGATIPIPYDFDFSGLVNAPYATPPEQLNLGSVRQRKYRGFCAHNAAVIAAARTLREKQSALLAELAAIPGLDRGGAAQASAFLQTFFAEIATDASVEANIVGRCAS